jgi:hypothetical protein
MTVRDLLAQLQRLPKDAELLAMEPGCEQYCERELDEVEWRGGRSTSTSAPGATANGAVAGAWAMRHTLRIGPEEAKRGIGAGGAV